MICENYEKFPSIQNKRKTGKYFRNLKQKERKDIALTIDRNV